MNHERQMQCVLEQPFGEKHRVRLAYDLVHPDVIYYRDTCWVYVRSAAEGSGCQRRHYYRPAREVRV